jgi:16S rRNA (guanine527-N7)-methyltransferase
VSDEGSSQSPDPVLIPLLENGLLELRLSVTAAQIRQLAELATLLGQWAPRINLTGHKEPVEIARRLILDAAGLASVLPELGLAGRLADLGSGAGFPGLPLAILYPSLSVSLVESRQKRIHFQREARRRLQLSRVEPLHGRAEQLEVEKLHDLVVAQAMTHPEHALQLMARWCRPGGRLVLPASDRAREPALPGLGLRPELREYRVPGTETLRRVWTFVLPSE